MKEKKIAIVGTVGLPANYGGFETLAEKLIKYHDASSLSDPITAYCSSRSHPSNDRDEEFLRRHQVWTSQQDIKEICKTLRLFSEILHTD